MLRIHSRRRHKSKTMMTTWVPDSETILKVFVDNLILKDKKERCLQQLIHPQKRRKFTDRLSHKLDSVLNMKYLQPFDAQVDGMQEIQKLLTLKKNEACYIISDINENDDLLLPFEDIFENVFSRISFATIIMNTSGNRFFLQTEASKDGTSRFIGIRI